MNAPVERPFRSRAARHVPRALAPPPFRRRILFEALEQRLLLSADGASSGIADELAAALLEAEAPQSASQVLEADAGASSGQTTISPQAWAEVDATAGSWIIETESGARALQAGDTDNVWRVTGADEGTLNGMPFTDVAILLGGADNQDTFYFEPGGSLSGYLHGGDGGFDTLVIEGGEFTSAAFVATGPQSGSVELDGNLIAYFGLEPIIDNSDTTDRVFTGTAGEDRIRLRDEGSGQLTIEAQNGTFESVTFSVPGATLTIDAGAGDDVITLELIDIGPTPIIVIDGGAGTDRLEADRDSDLILSDTTFGSDTESIGLVSIEQARLSGTALDSAGFTGAFAFAAGAPQWTPEGPGPITGGQVAGMAAQNQPVAGAINAIIANDCPARTRRT